VLIMVFMLGLALGAASRKVLFKEARKRAYLLMQLMLAALTLLILVCFTLLPLFSLPDGVVFALFILLAMGTAFITGL